MYQKWNYIYIRNENVNCRCWDLDIKNIIISRNIIFIEFSNNIENEWLSFADTNTYISDIKSSIICMNKWIFDKKKRFIAIKIKLLISAHQDYKCWKGLPYLGGRGNVGRQVKIKK